MFPIFFSVSSHDISLAEKVWRHLPDDWVYIYTRTGEEGADMWEEISRRELPQSQFFVVFWSRRYLTSPGCVRELMQANDLIKSGYFRSIVLRIDDTPLSWNIDFGTSTKPVFEALAPLLNYRTSAAKISAQDAIDLVQRVAEPLLGSDHPHLARHDLEQALRSAIRRDRFSYYPAVWVSGFNGVGRETLTRDFNRSFSPNGRGIVIEVNEASLPRQVLLRVESEALGADRDRLEHLNSLPDAEALDALTSAIERVSAGNHYLIFRHSRIVEESVDLPEWLDELVSALAPTTRPKLYIISQMPLLGERRARARDAIVAQRVPTIDEHVLTDFCYQLIGHFDPNPERWDDSTISQLVRSSGGNVGFLVSLARTAARMDDFDQIDELMSRDSDTLTASITTYVRWAFSQLRDFDDEQRVLVFLNDISPCDIVDLENAIRPERPMLRVLGKLIDLGLVEREGESLYRLTPLLSNRLSRDFFRPDLVAAQRKSLNKFARKPLKVKGDRHEYLRIESRIQASILSGTDPSAAVLDFVSASHWFQAGIRLYHARHREPAYRILRKAYLKRDQFSDASRLELTRYFALSATRNRKYDDTDTCISQLNSVFHTKGMAAFLQADLLEHRRRFDEAIEWYKKSIKLNKDKETRLERTYRPLIRCILSSTRPDFALAERYATDWLSLRRTVFSLKALAEVYVSWMFLGSKHMRAVPKDIRQSYDDALSDLANDPGVGSAHFEVKAEEARLGGDFDTALDYMDQAIAADPRFELRADRWRQMARSGSTALADRVIVELREAKINPEFRTNWQPFLPMLAETYAIALKVAHRPLAEINSFAPELSSDEIGAIVARVNRT